MEHLGNTSQDHNIYIGEVWHQRYDEKYKDYQNKQFHNVENIYGTLRDSVADLMDLTNYARRLETFIGASINRGSTKTILFLSSSPENADRLRVDKEGRVIEETITSAKSRNEIVFKHKTAIKYDTLSKALLEEKPTILHISGHSNKDFFIVDDDSGNIGIIKIDSLSHLLKSVIKDIQIVILNCCNSSTSAQILSSNDIYVVGMKGSIKDVAAIEFSKGFYQAIGSGEDFITAFNIGKALFGNKDKIIKPELWKNSIKIQ